MGPISRVTLDIIGAAGVGKDFDSLENKDSVLAKLYELVMRAPSYFMLANLLMPSWVLRNLKGTVFARTIEAQKKLRREVGAVLQDKKVDLDQERSARRNKDIIATIMRSGDFSDDYLVGQLLTFLAAG
jgi:cytochrome P450